jgi:hypothetical protein
MVDDAGPEIDQARASIVVPITTSTTPLPEGLPKCRLLCRLKNRRIAGLPRSPFNFSRVCVRTAHRISPAHLIQRLDDRLASFLTRTQRSHDLSCETTSRLNNLFRRFISEIPAWPRSSVPVANEDHGVFGVRGMEVKMVLSPKALNSRLSFVITS